MDRFIDVKHFIIRKAKISLKSIMDRFIGARTPPKHTTVKV